MSTIIIYDNYDPFVLHVSSISAFPRQAPPWPGTSPTPPGSALAFTVQPEEVKASHIKRCRVILLYNVLIVFCLLYDMCIFVCLVTLFFPKHCGHTEAFLR